MLTALKMLACVVGFFICVYLAVLGIHEVTSPGDVREVLLYVSGVPLGFAWAVVFTHWEDRQ